MQVTFEALLSVQRDANDRLQRHERFLIGVPPLLYFVCKVFQIKELICKVLIVKELLILPGFFFSALSIER